MRRGKTWKCTSKTWSYDTLSIKWHFSSLKHCMLSTYGSHICTAVNNTVTIHTHTQNENPLCPLRSCRIIPLQKRQVITQKLPALLWPVSRSAGMGPWWRKCNSVEEIGFRLLNPEAKLSSRRCTSVWTLIGSCGSRIAQQRGGGKGKNRIIINWVWPFPNRCYPWGQTQSYKKQSWKQWQVQEWFCGTAGLKMGGRGWGVRGRGRQSEAMVTWNLTTVLCKSLEPPFTCTNLHVNKAKTEFVQFLQT